MNTVEIKVSTDDNPYVLVVLEIHADDPAHTARLHQLLDRWQEATVRTHAIMSPPDTLRLEFRL